MGMAPVMVTGGEGIVVVLWLSAEELTRKSRPGGRVVVLWTVALVGGIDEDLKRRGVS